LSANDVLTAACEQTAATSESLEQLKDQRICHCNPTTPFFPLTNWYDTVPMAMA